MYLIHFSFVKVCFLSVVMKHRAPYILLFFWYRELNSTLTACQVGIYASELNP